MFSSTPPDFARQVLAASHREDVIREIARIYDELKQAIDVRKPICVASGKCCQFDRYGHRLFVTTMEMAAFVHQLPSSPGLNPAALDGGGCRFQQARLCGVHAVRPFGCRIFFCDPTATDWQQQQYETHHAQLKKLHVQLGVEYFYVEWRAALSALFDRHDKTAADE